METIYGIQADTETLREAHERQKRLQLQQQQSASAVVEKKSSSDLAGPPKPSLAARAISTSSIPSQSSTESSSSTNQVAATKSVGDVSNITNCATTAQPQPYLSGSSNATSPFFGAADYHCQHPSAAAQLRSATQSPSFLSKFYDADHHHRLPATVPWLALPSTSVTPGLGGTESPNMFGRRRSDGGTPTSGTSTPSCGGSVVHDKLTQESPQQESPQPYPPQPQHQHHHHHHHHLLSHQDLAALSRNNSPMPLNEALPNYLRRKSGDSTLQSMERSLSNTGSSSIVHTAPASPFVLPMHHPSSSLSVTVIPQGNVSNNHATTPVATSTSPPHMLFSFSNTTATTTGPSSTNRPEMERASSTGVLPMNRQFQNQSRHNNSNQHRHHQAQFGTNNQGATTISTNSAAAAAAAAVAANSQGSFFRTSTPLAGIPSNLTGGTYGGPHTTTVFGSSSTKLNPFGHAGDANFSSNKEVHA